MDNNQNNPLEDLESALKNTSLSNLSSKKITLDLSVFLEILWGSRDIAHPDEHIAELVAAIDSNNQFSYVQFPTPENKLTVPSVWRIKAWKVDEQRRQLEKAKSDERVALWDMKKQLIDEVAAGIEKKMGIPEIMAMDKARVIVEQGNIKWAKFYDVDIEDYVRREALMKLK